MKPTVLKQANNRVQRNEEGQLSQLCIYHWLIVLIFCFCYFGVVVSFDRDACLPLESNLKFCRQKKNALQKHNLFNPDRATKIIFMQDQKTESVLSPIISDNGVPESTLLRKRLVLPRDAGLYLHCLAKIVSTRQPGVSASIALW